MEKAIAAKKVVGFWKKGMSRAPTLSKEAIGILQESSMQLNQAQADHLIRTALIDKAKSFTEHGNTVMAAKIKGILEDGLPPEEVARVVSELSLGQDAQKAAAQGSGLSPQGKLTASRKQPDDTTPLPEAVLKPVLQKMSCRSNRWGHFEQNLETGEENRETWQTLMQKRRRGSKYREIMRDITGLADHLCRNWAARRIQAAWRAYRKGRSVLAAVGAIHEPNGTARPRDGKRLLQWALREAAEVRHKQALPEDRHLLDVMLKRLDPNHAASPNELDGEKLLDSNTRFLSKNLEKLIAPMTSPYQQQLRSLNLWFQPKLNLTLSMVRRVSDADQLRPSITGSFKHHSSRPNSAKSHALSRSSTHGRSAASRPTTAHSRISQPTSPASSKAKSSTKKQVPSYGFGRHVPKEEREEFDRQKYVPSSAMWASGLRDQKHVKRPAPLKRGQGLALVKQGRAAAAAAAAAAAKAANAQKLPPKTTPKARAGSSNAPVPGSSTAARSAMRAARRAEAAVRSGSSGLRGWGEGQVSDSGSTGLDSDDVEGVYGRQSFTGMTHHTQHGPQHAASPGGRYGHNHSRPTPAAEPHGGKHVFPFPPTLHHPSPSDIPSWLAGGLGHTGMHGSQAQSGLSMSLGPHDLQQRPSKTSGPAHAEKVSFHRSTASLDSSSGFSSTEQQPNALDAGVASMPLDLYFSSGPGVAELEALALWLEGLVSASGVQDASDGAGGVIEAAGGRRAVGKAAAAGAQAMAGAGAEAEGAMQGSGGACLGVAGQQVGRDARAVVQGLLDGLQAMGYRPWWAMTEDRGTRNGNSAPRLVVPVTEASPLSPASSATAAAAGATTNAATAPHLTVPAAPPPPSSLAPFGAAAAGVATGEQAARGASTTAAAVADNAAVTTALPPAVMSVGDVTNTAAHTAAGGEAQASWSDVFAASAPKLASIHTGAGGVTNEASGQHASQQLGGVRCQEPCGSPVNAQEGPHTLQQQWQQQTQQHTQHNSQQLGETCGPVPGSTENQPSCTVAPQQGWSSSSDPDATTVVKHLCDSYALYSGKPAPPLHVLLHLLCAGSKAILPTSQLHSQYQNHDPRQHQLSKLGSSEQKSHAVSVRSPLDRLRPMCLVRRSLAEEDARAHNTHYQHRTLSLLGSFPKPNARGNSSSSSSSSPHPSKPHNPTKVHVHVNTHATGTFSTLTHKQTSHGHEQQHPSSFSALRAVHTWRFKDLNGYWVTGAKQKLLRGIKVSQGPGSCGTYFKGNSDIWEHLEKQSKGRKGPQKGAHMPHQPSPANSHHQPSAIDSSTTTQDNTSSGHHLPSARLAARLHALQSANVRPDYSRGSKRGGKSEEEAQSGVEESEVDEGDDFDGDDEEDDEFDAEGGESRSSWAEEGEEAAGEGSGVHVRAQDKPGLQIQLPEDTVIAVVNASADRVIRKLMRQMSMRPYHGGDGERAALAKRTSWAQEAALAVAAEWVTSSVSSQVDSSTDGAEYGHSAPESKQYDAAYKCTHERGGSVDEGGAQRGVSDTDSQTKVGAGAHPTSSCVPVPPKLPMPTYSRASSNLSNTSTGVRANPFLHARTRNTASHAQSSASTNANINSHIQAANPAHDHPSLVSETNKGRATVPNIACVHTSSSLKPSMSSSMSTGALHLMYKLAGGSGDEGDVGSISSRRSFQQPENTHNRQAGSGSELPSMPQHKSRAPCGSETNLPPGSATGSSSDNGGRVSSTSCLPETTKGRRDMRITHLRNSWRSSGQPLPSSALSGAVGTLLNKPAWTHRPSFSFDGDESLTDEDSKAPSSQRRLSHSGLLGHRLSLDGPGLASHGSSKNSSGNSRGTPPPSTHFPLPPTSGTPVHVPPPQMWRRHRSSAQNPLVPEPLPFLHHSNSVPLPMHPLPSSASLLPQPPPSQQGIPPPPTPPGARSQAPHATSGRHGLWPSHSSSALSCPGNHPAPPVQAPVSPPPRPTHLSPWLPGLQTTLYRDPMTPHTASPSPMPPPFAPPSNNPTPQPCPLQCTSSSKGCSCSKHSRACSLSPHTDSSNLNLPPLL